MRPLPLALLLGALLLPRAAAAAAAAAPDPEALRFFEARIRPLLAAECWSCHSGASAKGGLRLDRPEGIRAGGSRGPALRADAPEQSLLLRAVRHEDPALRMPPGRKLPERAVADLERWLRMGAPWPAASNGGPAARPESGALHWALRPIRRPPVPAVRNRGWVRTPIDAFVLARLEARGLRPNPPADRRTLIRRATFDLTGLPPTPEEIHAFVTDRSPDAWEKVIDRLLASPAYGERWGRHWLDIARYADTNGLDENVHYGNAWRYRDWVIRAFNADLPFDRFLTMQIAGDLLAEGETDPHARQEAWIATGFLAVGPKFISEVDSAKVELDLIDEQLDTLGRAVMGMTLGCARCHDHKFDPITQRDYAALAGIFKSTKTLDVWKKPRMWFEHSLATEADRARRAAHERRIAEQKAAIERRLAEARAQVAAARPAGAASGMPKEEELPAEARADLARLREELARLERELPELPAAMGVTEGEPQDLPVYHRGDPQSPGEVVPRGVPAVLAGPRPPAIDRRRSGRLELARWLVAPEHPLTRRVFVNRVWRWHFGEGLVRTPDNFGRLGERPSHPELLDWLAVEFREGGWSIKRLHRLIMRSSVYMQSSADQPQARRLDPENRLLARFPVRRLEAEEIRDALLAVSGRLDRTMGGGSLPLKNREYVFDHTSKDGTRYDSRRRSVYLPVVRNHLYDVFTLFDFGDGAVPEGNRPTTTVAPQALFMLNSDLVMDAAAGLAARLRARQDLDTEGRLRLLWLLAYGRAPEPRETARMRALLARFERRGGTERAWEWLCHTALAANEFLFVR